MQRVVPYAIVVAELSPLHHAVARRFTVLHLDGGRHPSLVAESGLQTISLAGGVTQV